MQSISDLYPVMVVLRFQDVCTIMFQLSGDGEPYDDIGAKLSQFYCDALTVNCRLSNSLNRGIRRARPSNYKLVSLCHEGV